MEEGGREGGRERRREGEEGGQQGRKEGRGKGWENGAIIYPAKRIGPCPVLHCIEGKDESLRGVTKPLEICM